jgi:hypothetical protein
LSRIPANFSGIASKQTDVLKQVVDGELCPGSKVHGVRFVILSRREKNGLGSVFDIQKFAGSISGAPGGNSGLSGQLGIDTLANESRDNMRVYLWRQNSRIYPL